MITVAATQMKCGDEAENLKKAESLVRIAANRGANVVVLQELFQHIYFPYNNIDEGNFRLAQTQGNIPLLNSMTALAKELQVVIPVSFFEKHHNDYYSSIALIDADGSILGVYRKAHSITHGEKYYFTPSDTGFKVWQTKYGRIGVAASADQWFPEVARAMVLQGAEILLYPSAIGSTSADSPRDSKSHWHRVVQGQAAGNMVPIIASNRAGTEGNNTFYGSSFIAGPTGELLKVADRESEGVLIESLDLEALQIQRASFGLLRDRRPDLYRGLATRDGV